MLIKKDDERGRCNLNTAKDLIIRTFCLIVLPLLSLAIILTLWPGFISFGNPFVDNFELRSLLIATLGGGIGSFLDLITDCNDINTFKIDFNFSVRIIIGFILGFLVISLACANILKLNLIVDVTNPYSVFSCSALAGFCALNIASKMKKYVESWFQSKLNK